MLYVDRGNITVTAPYIASEFNLSTQSLGRILSAFLFGYAVGPSAGRMAGGSFWSAQCLDGCRLELGRDHVLSGLD